MHMKEYRLINSYNINYLLNRNQFIIELNAMVENNHTTLQLLIMGDDCLTFDSHFTNEKKAIAKKEYTANTKSDDVYNWLTQNSNKKAKSVLVYKIFTYDYN